MERFDNHDRLKFDGTKNTTVLCVGLNITDTSCSPGPSSTLKVPLGNSSHHAFSMSELGLDEMQPPWLHSDIK
jgi:hypothetical protein